MKKFFNLLLTMIFAAAVIGCSEEKVLNGGSDSGDTQPGVSFVFKGMNGGPVTYAESPIATEKEYEVSDMDVYMFEYTADASGKFLAKFSKGDYTTSTSGTNMTLKLPKLGEYGNGNKTFYFVANPSPTTAISATSNETLESAFRELLSVAQTGAKAQLLSTPLLFTGKTDGPVDPTGGVTANTVTMKRRVARFDIVNNYDNFKIQYAYVSDANIQGYIFGNATGSVAMPTNSLTGVYLTTRTYDVVGTDKLMRSAFYTYPGELGAGKMEIALLASVNGEAAEMFYVTGDVEIKPNYRYKLVVAEDLKFGVMTLNLTYADWDDEDATADIDTKKAMILTDFAVDAAAPTPAYWDEPTLTYDFSEGAAKFTFNVKNAVYLDYTIERISGSEAGITTAPKFTSSQVLTYGAEILHNCTFTLPVLAQPKYLRYKLTVKNRANHLEFAELFFEYPIEAAFAKSNIIWDAANSKMLFAITEADNATIPANCHGLFFPGGSLIGTNGIASGYSLIFNPNPYNETTNPTGIKNPTGYTTTPYYFSQIDDMPASYDLFATYNGNTGFIEAEGRGDICRYVSAKGWVSGKWRLPTLQEWVDLSARKSASKIGAGSSVGTSAAEGRTPILHGYALGIDGSATTSISAPAGRTVFIPNSGYKAWGSTKYSVGSLPYYYSSTPMSKTKGLGGGMYLLTEGVINAGIDPFDTSMATTNQFAPVRCIRE